MAIFNRLRTNVHNVEEARRTFQQLRGILDQVIAEIEDSGDADVPTGVASALVKLDDSTGTTLAATDILHDAANTLTDINVLQPEATSDFNIAYNTSNNRTVQVKNDGSGEANLQVKSDLDAATINQIEFESTNFAVDGAALGYKSAGSVIQKYTKSLSGDDILVSEMIRDAGRWKNDYASATPASGDLMIFEDIDDSDTVKYASWGDLVTGLNILTTSSTFSDLSDTPADPGAGTFYLEYDGGFSWTAVSGLGDVDGPASSTDYALARFDGTTGKLIQNSTVLLDAGIMTFPGASSQILDLGSLTFAGPDFNVISGDGHARFIVRGQTTASDAQLRLFSLTGDASIYYSGLAANAKKIFCDIDGTPGLLEIENIGTSVFDVSIDGDLTVGTDLAVTGSITSLGSPLSIDDGGTGADVSAQLANEILMLSADQTFIDGTLLTYASNTLSGLIEKISTAASGFTIEMNSSSDRFVTSSNPGSGEGGFAADLYQVENYIDFAELATPGSVPGTPSSGRYIIYSKDDGKIYGKNDAGAEHDLTASGSGDVTGPGSSTDNAVATWDGTGGDTLQDSTMTYDGVTLSVPAIISGNSATITGDVDAGSLTTSSIAVDSTLMSVSRSGSVTFQLDPGSGSVDATWQIGSLLATGTASLVFAPLMTKQISCSRATTETLSILNTDASNVMDVEVDGDVRVDGLFEVIEQTTPSTQSGYGQFYCKSDGKPYFQNDAGTETDLTAGGGGGSSTLEDLTDTEPDGAFTYTTGYVLIGDGADSYDEGFLDADYVTFTPGDSDNWNSGDPGDVDDALDELASNMQPLLPSAAPTLDQISYSTGDGTAGKNTWNAANTIASYTTAADAGSVNNSGDALDVNMSTSGNEHGVYDWDTISSVTGTLNDDISASDNYPADSFGPGGSDGGATNNLVLKVNGSTVHTVDLLTAGSGSDVNGNGSGFNLSDDTPVYFADLTPFTPRTYRTGTWTVDSGDMTRGYNVITVDHVTTGGTTSTNVHEFLLDDDNTPTSDSGDAAIANNLSGTKHISGVEYYTGGSFTYSGTITNAKRNTIRSSSNALFYDMQTSGLAFNDSTDSIPDSGGDEAGTVSVSEIFDFNSNQRSLGGSISCRTNVDRTVNSSVNVLSTSISNVLFDNYSTTGSSDLSESFNDEDYRQPSNADFNSDLTDQGQWNGETHLTGAGYSDGLMVVGGALDYPYGDWNYANGPDASTNPDYTSASGEKFYFRSVPLSTALSNFAINIQGSATLVDSGTATSSTDDVEICVRFPSETGWMDLNQAYVTGQWGSTSDTATGDATVGAFAGTYGSDQTIPTSALGFTIGTKSSVDSYDKMYVRIKAPSGWTGNITSITVDESP